MTKTFLELLAHQFQQYRHILLFIFVLQLLIYFLPVVAVPLITDDFISFESLSFVLPWVQWDAYWYLSIAGEGYPTVSEGEGWKSIAFLPLYPAFISLVSRLGFSLPLAALIVSRMASFIGAFLFYRLAEHELGKRVAFWSLAALLVFPTSFFLYAPYTEGLFFLLTVGSVYSARKGYWALAGILAGLSILTRVTGLVMLPTLLTEWWLQRKEGRPVDRVLLGLCLSIVVALGIIGATSYYVHGTPFMYFTALRAGWQKYMTWPWVGMYVAFRGGFIQSLTPLIFISKTAEFMSAAGLIGATVASRYRLRSTYVAYTLFSTLLLISVSSLLSTARYALSVWPIFFLLGLLYKKYPYTYVLWLVFSAVSLMILAMRFVRGMWTF